MADAERNVIAVQQLARQTAYAAEAARDEDLKSVRARVLAAVAGRDPNKVILGSDDYLFGACDALTAVVATLEEWTLPASTQQLLLKSERARILNFVVAYPGEIQGSLAQRLGLAESAMANYVKELAAEGLIQPAVSSSGRGRAWSLTPWGRKAWQMIAAKNIRTNVSDAEIAVARKALVMPGDPIDWPDIPPLADPEPARPAAAIAAKKIRTNAPDAEIAAARTALVMPGDRIDLPDISPLADPEPARPAAPFIRPGFQEERRFERNQEEALVPA